MPASLLWDFGMSWVLTNYSDNSLIPEECRWAVDTQMLHLSYFSHFGARDSFYMLKQFLFHLLAQSFPKSTAHLCEQLNRKWENALVLAIATEVDLWS